MTPRHSKVKLLDATISALEHLILNAPDDQILSQSPRLSFAGDDVKALIAQRLVDQVVLSEPDRAAAVGRSRVKSKRVPQASNAWAARLAMLQRLIATHPELQPRLGAVFGAGKVPTSDELDSLMKELIRLGLVAADKSVEG